MLTVFLVSILIIFLAIMLIKGRIDKLERRVRNQKTSSSTHTADMLFEQADFLSPSASDSEASDSKASDSKALTQSWSYDLRRDFMRNSSIRVASLPCFLVYSENSDKPAKITEHPFPKLIIKSSKKNGLQVFFLSPDSCYLSKYTLFFGFGDEVLPLHCHSDSSARGASYSIDEDEDIDTLLLKISSNKGFFIEYEEKAESKGCLGISKQFYFESLSLLDLSFFDELNDVRPSDAPDGEKEITLDDLDVPANRLAF